jgi:thiol-disulfide isomerase/thioredoxin
MTLSPRILFACLVALLAAPAISAQVKESAIVKQMDGLRSLPDAQRPAATIKLAQDIATLPPGQSKLKYADGLAHLVTEGDQGIDTEQAVGDTLAKALAESPIPVKGDQPPMPYMDLARLVHYEGITTTLTDPLYTKAVQALESNDAGIQKQDFTLKDLNKGSVTLSALKGKIVLVNFWATWCPPCRVEMPTLDWLSTRFADQGLVVLSITDEEQFKVGSFFAGKKYHPTVLFDFGGKVHKQFHVTGIPQTFLFDRDGKLIGIGIDERSSKQFLTMLSKTDLHP